jgi:hypothetical protein
MFLCTPVSGTLGASAGYQSWRGVRDKNGFWCFQGRKFAGNRRLILDAMANFIDPHRLEALEKAYF